MILPIDQRNIDVGVGQRSGRGKTTEPAPDDHNMWTTFGHSTHHLV